MLLLKRWNYIWLLPCALLQLMPDRAAAQSAPMTEIEKDCVAIAAEDAVQYNEAFRQTFDETVRSVQEQRCPPNPDWMTLPETFAMQPLLPMLPQAMQPKLSACFIAEPERVRDVAYDIFLIMQAALEKALPRPFCPQQ